MPPDALNPRMIRAGLALSCWCTGIVREIAKAFHFGNLFKSEVWRIPLDCVGERTWRKTSGGDVELAVGAGNDRVELWGVAFDDGGFEVEGGDGLVEGGWVWCEQLEAEELAA